MSIKKHPVLAIIAAAAFVAMAFGAVMVHAAPCSTTSVGGTGLCYPNFPAANSFLLGNGAGALATTSSPLGASFGGTGVASLGSGISTFLGTPSSANFGSALTDETGSGLVVFSNSPALVTPNLGTPSAITLTSGTGLPISTGVSGLGTNVATFLGTPTSANLAAAVTNETGSGLLVFGTSPVLTTPNLGTPSALTLTNATGLPLGGITGFGTNVATFLGTPSSANFAAALTDKTGTGTNVFSISPTFTGTANFANSSTTIASFGQLYIGGTATTTISSNGSIVIPSGSTLTNTGVANGCATWSSGVIVSAGTACGTSSGSVTSVGLSDTNSTLTVTGSPITTAGTINATLNLAHANAWTGLQSFANASSTNESVTGTGFYGSTATTTINADGKGGIKMGTGSTLQLGTTTAGTLFTTSTGVVYAATPAAGGSTVTQFYATNASAAAVSVPVVSGDTVTMRGYGIKSAPCGGADRYASLTYKLASWAATTTVDNFGGNLTANGAERCIFPDEYMFTATTTDTLNIATVNQTGLDEVRIVVQKVH